MPEPKNAVAKSGSSVTVSSEFDEDALESDSLAALEERIRRIVELVHTARAERDRAIQERDAVIHDQQAAAAEKHKAVEAHEKLVAERDAAVAELANAQSVTTESKKLRAGVGAIARRTQAGAHEDRKIAGSDGSAQRAIS